ncbi:lipoprotein, partial [Rhodopirellula baltica SH28]
MNADEIQLFAKNLIDKFASEKHNLLFIHGFKNTFEDAALRAAQLGVDLKIRGATFLYSWASRGNLKGYSADEATIEASVPFCLEFVLKILSSFPDVPLHVIAHSMGNRLAVRTFEKLAAMDKIPGT